MAAAIIPIGTLFTAKGVPGQIRVISVGAHPLLQEGLAAVINREEDMAVVAAASNTEEALRAVRRYHPDVVTLDLELPDSAGEDLARRILRDFPGTRIVAIISLEGYVPARRAMDAGVHGYVSKAAPPYELVRAIRRVNAGGRAIPGRISFSAAKRFIRDTIVRRGTTRLQLVAG